MSNADRNTAGHGFGSMDAQEHKKWERDGDRNEVKKNTTQNANREKRYDSDMSESETNNDDSLVRGQVNRRGREEWGGYKGY